VARQIDIHIEIPPVAFRELRSDRDGSSSAALGEQVIRARQIQRERFGQNNTMLNGRMSSRLLRKYCTLDDASEQILKQALTELGLTHQLRHLTRHRDCCHQERRDGTQDDSESTRLLGQPPPFGAFPYASQNANT